MISICISLTNLSLIFSGTGCKGIPRVWFMIIVTLVSSGNTISHVWIKTILYGVMELPHDGVMELPVLNQVNRCLFGQIMRKRNEPEMAHFPKTSISTGILKYWKVSWSTLSNKKTAIHLPRNLNPLQCLGTGNTRKMAILVIIFKITGILARADEWVTSYTLK